MIQQVADDYACVDADSEAVLWAWLDAHHGRSEGVWLVTYRRHMGVRHVSREVVLDALTAYGWVDGTRRVLDSDRQMLLIAPRRAQPWTRAYKERAARLEATGRMHAAGRAAIEAAKASGAWTFFDEVDALVKPPDLVAALEAFGASAWFDEYSVWSRRATLRWIKLAKRPETRARRIAATASAVVRNDLLPGRGQ